MRVGGDIAPNSIVREGRDVHFILAQDDVRLKVVYSGIDPLPDTFKDGAQALADGKLGPDGVFHATKIQAKCASKYEAKPTDVETAVSDSALVRHSWKISARSRSCSRSASRSMRWSASLVGKWGRRPFLILSAERAVYCVWALLTTCRCDSGLFADPGDFRLAYVCGAQQSRDAGHLQVHRLVGRTGRLAAVVDLAARLVHRRRGLSEPPQVPRHDAVRHRDPDDDGDILPDPDRLRRQALQDDRWRARDRRCAGDGQGLNPLLQYWTMVIHPPMLYLGYVGFAVPFAFAIGSLITKQPGDAWIHTTRRWTLVTWMFQTTGVLLGAGWAYAVLGWGGYWGWDPVENASLLPWITATAFLHSVMMQEKKGMMKVWNMVLVSSTFFLCIFGTFLTRSGVVQSVHAFAQSSIGTVFRDVPGRRHRGHGVPDPEPPGLS